MAGGRLLFRAVSAAVMLWSSAVMAQYYGYPPSDQPYISVTGEAEIKVVPDKAVIILGIEAFDSSMVVANKECDRILESVIKAVKRQGVDQADIQTDYLHAEPTYKSWDKPNTFIGNYVKRRIVITLEDMSKFDDLISAVVEADVSRILDVSFYTNDLKEHREQARALAIKAAKEKAEKMTSEIGQKIGKATRISEDKSGWYSWYYSWDRFSRRRNQYVTSQVSIEPEYEGEIPEAVGKISITAKVTASFLLE